MKSTIEIDCFSVASMYGTHIMSRRSGSTNSLPGFFVTRENSSRGTNALIKWGTRIPLLVVSLNHRKLGINYVIGEDPPLDEIFFFIAFSRAVPGKGDRTKDRKGLTRSLPPLQFGAG